METGKTNEACISSVAIDENAGETTVNKEKELSAYPQTISPNKNASVAKCLIKWRKYLILLFTPILLAPLPIAVRTTVSRQYLIELNLFQWQKTYLNQGKPSMPTSLFIYVFWLGIQLLEFRTPLI